MSGLPGMGSSGRVTLTTSLLSLPFIIFQEVLQQGNPSAQRIRAVVEWALRDVGSAPRIWAILHRALTVESRNAMNHLKGDISEEDTSQKHLEKIKFLWYLIDALMKHVPHVYITLISPHLVGAVEHSMPWGSLWVGRDDRLTSSVENLTGGVPRWCVEMIRSWEGLLPLPVYEEVCHRMSEIRMKNNLLPGEEEEDGFNTEYEEVNNGLLTSALEKGEDQHVNGAHVHSLGGVQGPRCKGRKQVETVTLDEWQKLYEDWDSFYFLVKSVVEEGERMDIVQSPSVYAFHLEREKGEKIRDFSDSSSKRSFLESEKLYEEKVKKELASPLLSASSSRTGGKHKRHSPEEADEYEEAYVPDYVSGAQPRELPVVDTPRLRTRRDVRRRQREDDF